MDHVFSNPPPDDQPPSVSDLTEDLLHELRESGEQRFRWIPYFQGDFQDWVARRTVWEEKCRAAIQGLKEKGKAEQADLLSTSLLSKRIVTRPGEFSLMWTTGYGREKMTIFFFEGFEFGSDPDGGNHIDCINAADHAMALVGQIGGRFLRRLPLPKGVGSHA